MVEGKNAFNVLWKFLPFFYLCQKVKLKNWKLKNEVILEVFDHLKWEKKITICQIFIFDF